MRLPAGASGVAARLGACICSAHATLVRVYTSICSWDRAGPSVWSFGVIIHFKPGTARSSCAALACLRRSQHFGPPREKPLALSALPIIDAVAADLLQLTPICTNIYIQARVRHSGNRSSLCQHDALPPDALRLPPLRLADQAAAPILSRLPTVPVDTGPRNSTRCPAPQSAPRASHSPWPSPSGARCAR